MENHDSDYDPMYPYGLSAMQPMGGNGEVPPGMMMPGFHFVPAMNGLSTPASTPSLST